MSSEKTIDGLPVRRANSSRAVVMKQAGRPAKKGTKIPVKSAQPAKSKKAKPEKPKKSRAAAHADFLQPVETFDFNLDEKELKKEAKKDKKEKKAKKEKKPISKKRKIITRIALAFVLILLAGVAALCIWGNDLIAKLTGGASNLWDAFSALTSENYVDLKTDENGRTNILVFGTSGYDMAGSAGKGHHDGSQLTDSIMVISLDQNTGDVAMTSMPRDLKVPRACYAGKINEVYTCNNANGTDEAAGAEALEAVVGDVLGITFQYRAHINWESLIKVVNTLGGITVTLDEDIYDPNYTKIMMDAGKPYTIDGDTALGLARARHGTAGGDFSRGTSQQKILIGIKEKVVGKMNEGSFSMTDAIGLISALGDNFRSNISIEEIKSAVHLAEDIDFDSMRQIYLINYLGGESYMTTSNINGISFVVPKAGVGNYTKIHALIAKEFSSDPVIREEASVLVLNGTETSGLANTEATELEKLHYKIGAIDNAPTTGYKETAVYLLSPNTAKGTAEALQARYNINYLPASELPAGVSASYDIVVILGTS